MTALILDLPPDLYARLHEEAVRQGKPPEGIAREWLAERLSPPPTTDQRAAARAALHVAGLLVAEPIDEGLRASITGPELSVESVGAALERTGGPPLSTIIIEQRGPKG